MLEKEEEFQFLENLKRITKGRILITTPTSRWDVRGEKSPLEREHIFHLSAWDVEDFNEMDFNIIVVGFRFLRLGNRMCYIPTCLAMLFTPISFCVPKFSGFLIA